MALFDKAEEDDRFVDNNSEIYIFKCRINEDYVKLYKQNDHAYNKTKYLIRMDGTFLNDDKTVITGPYIPEKPAILCKTREERATESKTEFDEISHTYSDIAKQTVEKCKRIILDHLMYVDEKGEIRYHSSMFVGELPDNWKDIEYSYLNHILKQYEGVYGYDSCISCINFSVFVRNDEPVLEGITLSFTDKNRQSTCIYGDNGWRIAAYLNPLTIIDVTKLVIKYSHLLDVPYSNRKNK